MAERLGIVYTPVEVVDFIIHSVNHILKTEFGETLGSRMFTISTRSRVPGTFITRLMQSGLISVEQLKHKYKQRNSRQRDRSSRTTSQRSTLSRRITRLSEEITSRLKAFFLRTRSRCTRRTI